MTFCFEFTIPLLGKIFFYFFPCWRLILVSFSCRFHDHQMISSRKDALGTELLSVPFPKEELEAILEDLLS